MTVRNMVEKMIRNWGTDVTVYHRGVPSTAKGVFVSTTSRSWQNMQNVFTELGETPRGQYNYIGAMEPVAEKGDILEVNNKRYLLRRAEVVYDRKGPLYRWGLCVERGGDDEWGNLI